VEVKGFNDYHPLLSKTNDSSYCDTSLSSGSPAGSWYLHGAHLYPAAKPNPQPHTIILRKINW